MKKCGVSVDKESLDAFFKQIEGKKVVDAVKEGAKKHVSMPCGGGGGARPAAAAGAAAAEAPKEEPKKEDEPEDVDMGGLFGDDDDY